MAKPDMGGSQSGWVWGEKTVCPAATGLSLWERGTTVHGRAHSEGGGVQVEGPGIISEEAMGPLSRCHGSRLPLILALLPASAGGTSAVCPQVSPPLILLGLRPGAER